MAMNILHSVAITIINEVAHTVVKETLSFGQIVGQAENWNPPKWLSTIELAKNKVSHKHWSPRFLITLSIIAGLIKRHVNRNYGKICSPTSNSKSTTYRKINSSTWSNQTGGGLVNFTYAYTKGSRQKTDILRSGWPDRKQMWKLWPIFSLKFDSLILKTHFISLWRVSKMHFSCPCFVANDNP